MIYVCGGSNSVRRGGWADHFLKKLDAPGRNLSVGASSSLMGAYRTIADATLKPGDTVIWEYALNDLNHIDQHGYDEADLLAFAEFTLRHCSACEAAFLPLILHPQNVTMKVDKGPYLAKLKTLFDAYGVLPLDAMALVEDSFGFGTLATNFYGDPNHVKVNSVFVDLINHTLKERLADATIPAKRDPLHAAPDEQLLFTSEFSGGAATRIVNALVDVVGHAPKPNLRLNIPKDGTLVALSVMAARRGGGVRMRCDKKTVHLSLCHSESAFDKPLFKVINLSKVVQKPIQVKAGQSLRFDWSSKPGWHAADFGFSAQLNEKALTNREGLIVGALFRVKA